MRLLVLFVSVVALASRAQAIPAPAQNPAMPEPDPSSTVSLDALLSIHSNGKMAAKIIAPELPKPSTGLGKLAIDPIKLKLGAGSSSAMDKLTTADMEGNVDAASSSKPANTANSMMEPQPIDQEAPKPQTPPPAKKEFHPAVPEPSAQKSEEPAPIDNRPSIVIAIPSMRRWQKDKSPAPEHYLYNLVTGLWNQMNDADRKKVSFLLMNVDKEPEKHVELLQLSGHPAVKIINKNSQAGVFGGASNPVMTSEGKAKLEDGREVSVDSFNWVAGETRDAPLLLLEASRRAPYVIFLEDDVMATHQAISKIFTTLDEVKREGKADFLMIDLYTPAISWGPSWAGNKERYEFTCCTQAMLFNSAHVPALVEYELSHPSAPVDDNIRDFYKANQQHAILAMVPNPFEHIGRFSSNPEKSTGITEHKSLNFVP